MVELNFKKVLPFNVYGYSIELSSNDDKLLNTLVCENGRKFYNEYYNEKIEDHLKKGEKSGLIAVDGQLVRWNCVVFVVESEWCDENESSSVINGAFSDYDTAKRVFDKIIEKDILEHWEHKNAVEKGKESGYAIHKTDYGYVVFFIDDYEKYHFSITIHKTEIDQSKYL